jgi:hypothetical protein
VPPSGGYGIGLFDSEGPEKFAKSIEKITAALTGVQSGFTNFGTAANKSLSGLGQLIDSLTKKLGDFQKAAQGAGGSMGGGGGRSGGGPPGGGAGGSGGTGARDGSWSSPRASNGDFTNVGPLNTGQGTQPDGSALAAQTKDIWGRMPEETPKPATQQSMVSPGNQQGGINWGAAAGAMIPKAAGTMANSLQQGAAGNLVSSAIQGASIGQMTAPAYGVSAKSMYVFGTGTFAQNPQDVAQANYYATTYMGAAPGSQNWSTIQRGANQLMTLMPNMTRQQAMVTQNQMQQPGTLNAGLMFGLNFRPGGKMMDPQSQYALIYQKMFAQYPGGKPTGDQFQAYMAPGGPGENNLASMGIQPGTDAYQGFMQYAQTRIGLANKNQAMPGNIGTKAGAKQAGLATPAYAQLQAQTAKSSAMSQAEPGIAAAAKNLNDAAAALLKAVGPLAGLGGGAIGKLFGSGQGLLGGLHVPGVPSLGLGTIGSIGSHLPGVGGIIKSIFQQGGQVPGTGPQLAVVHGGEYVLTKDDVDKMQGKKGGHGAGAGGILGSVKGLTKGAGGKGDADSILKMLTEKPSDNPTVALSMLLSPPPAGSLLASLAKGGAQHQLGAGKTAAPAQTGGKGNAGVGGAGVPGQWVVNGQLTPAGMAALAGAGGMGGTTAATQPGAATGTAGGQPATGAGAWKYQSAGVGAMDLSGMFAGSSTTGSQTSDGSGKGSGGSGGTGSGTPTNLSGSGNVQQAYNFFIGKGLKDFQSAGILGNLAQESGINPGSAQAGGPGRGIAQWSVGGRWDTLVAWAKSANRDPNSLGTQLDFLWQELNSTEKGALSALQGSSDVSGATTAFEQGYERAGTPAMANRIKYAQNVLSSKGANYARGTQLVARTQLAMLHRGEAVVPAADNYSSAPYNKGGSVGSGSTVHLNFKAGSVILQVPANSNQQDMDAIAKQFVAAVSKPQNLASVRSS